MRRTSGIAGCCALAASGQAAAALPSATSNSRRPMGDCHTPLPREVRNGNDITPLFTFKEARMLGRHAFARRQFICWRDVPHSGRPSSSRYVGSAAHPLRRAAVYYRSYRRPWPCEAMYLSCL